MPRVHSNENLESEEGNSDWSDEVANNEYAYDEDWSGMTGDFTKQFTAVSSQRSQPNSQQRQNNIKRITVNDKSLSNQLSAKITLSDYETVKPSLTNSGSGKKAEISRARHRDKSDRATVEQVLDPRTRMIIFKLLSQGFISEINGCISTGKEANVYHATKPDGTQLAIKIFKTSILLFKDRDKYVSGEYRFRNGYCKGNPRKMVRTWAEKEFRNLNRIYKAGIASPEPLLLKSHVLVMGFLGEDGWPAPRLKDAEFSTNKACEMYTELVRQLRVLYNECKLVHGDLSEYNLLYHNNQAYWIDVSQSVEHEHPHAHEFLRKDCVNINQFFMKKQVSVLTTQELFEFVTDPSITDKNSEQCIQRLMDKANARSLADLTDEEKISAEVFMKTFIPKSLEEIRNPEKDIRSAVIDGNSLSYTTVVGLKPDLSAVEQQPTLLAGESDNESGSEGEENEVHDSSLQQGRPKDESTADKKVRKQAVKNAKADKRQQKMPKHIKKRKLKVGKTHLK
ncbi:serine/threonine-protein kinase RIO1-like [Watersipora subatra]|uniref:serine/threonine-protein kinase RIO1-like n=1 Tax=Watersipora subatra TaxID=2589382 RepID=UPI00355AD2CA